MQNLDRARDTCAAGRSQTVCVGAPDQYSSSSQAQSFDNVAATANAAIQQDFDAIA